MYIIMLLKQQIMHTVKCLNQIVTYYFKSTAKCRLGNKSNLEKISSIGHIFRITIIGNRMAGRYSKRKSSSYGSRPAKRLTKRKRMGKARAVRGQISSFGGRKELKYLDTFDTVTGVCDSTSGSTHCLNAILQGDDNISRDGRQVKIISCEIKGFLKPQGLTAGVAPNLIRIALVWDNAVNARTMATTHSDIFTEPSAFIPAFPIVDNANRFTILWEEMISMGFTRMITATSVGVAQSPGTFAINKYRKINAITQYITPATVVPTPPEAMIQNGGLFLVCIGTEPVGQGHNFLFNARIRFVDV